MSKIVFPLRSLVQLKKWLTVNIFNPNDVDVMKNCLPVEFAVTHVRGYIDVYYAELNRLRCWKMESAHSRLSIYEITEEMLEPLILLVRFHAFRHADGFMCVCSGETFKDIIKDFQVPNTFSYPIKRQLRAVECTACGKQYWWSYHPFIPPKI